MIENHRGKVDLLEAWELKMARGIVWQTHYAEFNIRFKDART